MKTSRCSLFHNHFLNGCNTHHTSTDACFYLFIYWCPTRIKGHCAFL